MGMQWTKRFMRSRFEMFATKVFGWHVDNAADTYYALDYMPYGRAKWSIVQYGKGRERHMSRLSDRRTAQELSAFMEGMEFVLDNPDMFTNAKRR
jgi:hypothetical protein